MSYKEVKALVCDNPDCPVTFTGQTSVSPPEYPGEPELETYYTESMDTEQAKGYLLHEGLDMGWKVLDLGIGYENERLTFHDLACLKKYVRALK